MNGKAIEEWFNAVGAKVEVTNGDAALIRHLAIEILERWKGQAEASADPEKAFSGLYKEHKEKAQGAIVAIIELVHAVGDGKAMPGTFKRLMI